MNKSKHSVIALLLTVVFLAVGAFAMTACGDKTPKQALTWEVSHATVAVEGYSELPVEVDQNTVLSFTVTPDTGYEVDSVVANAEGGKTGKKITPKNGVYTYTVSANVTITVVAVEKVKSIEIASQPTDLLYFAGESFDPAGMVVNVTYETGRTQNNVTDYEITPSVFNGGETEVTVSFGGVEANVALASRVEYLVTINPNGGVIAQSYLDNLAAMELNNYAVVDGVVQFSYFSDFEGTIAMPTSAEVSRENSNFKGWAGGQTIDASADTTINAVANWELIIAKMSKVQLVLENNTPYLVIDATVNFAGEFNLYLYEGNAQVFFNGDKYSGAQGEAFQVKFDLFRLAEGEAEDGSSFEGKWMDIRLKAIVDGNEETQEILVNDPNIQVDQTQKIFASNASGAYAFLFANYQNALKVYYNAVDYTFTYDMAEVEGVPYLNVNLKGLSAYAGNTAQLSAWAGSLETEPVGAVISADGEATIKIDMRTFGLNTNCYFHFAIVDGEGNTVYGGTSTNLKVAMCMTSIPVLAAKAGEITNANKFMAADGIAYYVGYAWDGLMLYAKDEVHAMEYTGLTIEKVDGKIYYVLTGTSKGYETITFQYDFQHNANVDGAGWGYEYINAEGAHASSADGEADIATMTQTVTVENGGAWKLYLPASDIAAGMGEAEMWALGVHLGTTNKPDLKLTSTAVYVLSGIKYSVKVDGDTWNNTTLVMEKTTEPDTTVIKEYTLAGVAVVNNNGAANLVVTVNYQGYTAEEINAISWLFDLQANANINADGSWTRHLADVKPIVTVNATNFTLAWDISALPSKAYTMHLGVGTEGDAPDYKPAEAFSVDTVIGNKAYNVRCVPGSEDGKDFWGCVGLTITEAGTPKVEVASVELVQEGDKIYYVVNGIYENLTAEQIAAMYIDLEIDKVDYAQGKLTVTGENGVFQIKVDVTDFAAGQYWPHIYYLDKKADVKYDANTSITANGKTYSLVVSWSMPTLKIA